MSHHFEAPRANRVDDFGTFSDIRNFELLLEEDARLLVRRLDDSGDKGMIWRRGRWMKQREEIDRLERNRRYEKRIRERR